MSQNLPLKLKICTSAKPKINSDLLLYKNKHVQPSCCFGKNH